MPQSETNQQQPQENNGNNAKSEQNSKPAVPPPSVKRYVHEYSDIALRDAILFEHQFASPLEEMIGTAEAAFEFAYQSQEMESNTKNVFFQLEKQFGFYRRLMMQ
jgi:hypothetical protein